MKKTIRSFIVASVLASTVALSGGCMYGGVAAAGDHVVITRNDMFFAGLLRKVFVCKITEGGVTQCSEAETP